tara:strand:+ start:5020 stop:5217 length:198 start_codon:yes stop_codon:yes gene_type:complete
MSNKEQKFLTEADIDRIAEKAAERALEKVYAEVGKSVSKKLMWIMGVVSISLIVWLSSFGGLTKL